MILAGCSEAPTDGDVRLAVRKITGNCRYFTITHVLKVNWALPGSSDYQVDIQYSIETSPLPGAKNVTNALITSLAALNTRLTAATIERDRDFNANADFLDRIAHAQNAGNEALAREDEQQRSAFVAQKLDPSLKLARELTTEKAMLIKQGTSPLRDEFFKACPDTSQAVYERVYDNADVEQYVEGHTKDFATTIQMVKAGQDWQMKE
ncbi:MAG TPA: hypothetical protein VGM52_07230 [Herbaspirillum sp.]